MPQIPSMGRIVIFTDNSGNEFPAIIIRCHSETVVNLVAMKDQDCECRFFSSVKEGEQTNTIPTSYPPLSWHWPPRV